jgi:hypothetical protein
MPHELRKLGSCATTLAVAKHQAILLCSHLATKHCNNIATTFELEAVKASAWKVCRNSDNLKRWLRHLVSKGRVIIAADGQYVG